MFVHRKGCHPKDRGRPVGRKNYRGKGIQRISCTVLGGKSASQISRDPEEIKAEDILNKKVKCKSKKANEIILKADRAHFWSNGYNCRKQTTSHERCPLSSVGTSPLGTIRSRWVTTENQQSSTSTGAVKEYILRDCNGKKDPFTLFESNNIRLFLV